MTESYNPKLEDSALSEMLVGVANKDKQYIGDEGTRERITKSPLTLGVTDKGLVVIDNQMVAKRDGVSALGDASMAIKTCIRYYHEGAVMELVPGQTPFMKPVEDKDDVDAGSAITEILQAGHMHVHVPPVEKAWVESGFYAILVLFYEDPENPKLEAMNRPKLLNKLADLKKKNLTPSDEHFTPLVNISRESDTSEKFTTALYFTTKEYTYFIYVDKTNLTLKKYKTGDTDPSAHPRNNKQFLDRQETENCTCVV